MSWGRGIDELKVIHGRPNRDYVLTKILRGAGTMTGSCKAGGYSYRPIVENAVLYDLGQSLKKANALAKAAEPVSARKNNKLEVSGLRRVGRVETPPSDGDGFKVFRLSVGKKAFFDGMVLEWPKAPQESMDWHMLFPLSTPRDVRSPNMLVYAVNPVGGQHVMGWYCGAALRSRKRFEVDYWVYEKRGAPQVFASENLCVPGENSYAGFPTAPLKQPDASESGLSGQAGKSRRQP